MAGTGSIVVTGLWLRRIGDRVQMLAEVDGAWKLAAEEPFDCPFSHIAEPNGAPDWKPDPIDAASEPDHV